MSESQSSSAGVSGGSTPAPGSAASLSSSSTSSAPSSTSSSTNAPSSVSNSADSLSSSASTSNNTSAAAAAGGQQSESSSQSAAAASSSATAAAASSTAAAMEVDSGASSNGSSNAGAGSVRTQITCIQIEQKKVAESVLRHLSKMLAALKKSPNLLATRKFRADNIAVKKFVVDVSGALAIAKYVGYELVELTDKKTPYLLIEEAKLAQPDTQRRLDEAIEAVNATLAVYDAPPGTAAAAAAAAAPAEKKLCEGGCGFWGSPETEGFCSLCFKKKFLAGGGAVSPAKASAAAPSSFVTPPRGQGSAPVAGAAPIPALGGSLSLGAGGSSEAKCLRHCGRIAAPDCKGFCKQCLDTLTVQGQKAPPKRWKCLFDGAIVKLRAVHRFNLGKKPVQTERNRCWVCRKKIGITGFECRCRYVFCGQHRYMEQHECSYDIKSLHRKKLKKENEEIRAAKIIKL